MAESIVYTRDQDGNLVSTPDQATPDGEPKGVALFREHFCGKRASARSTITLSAAIQGRHGTFIATVVDISRSGVLLHIDDEAFAPIATGNQLIAYSGRVMFHFEDGMRLALEGNVVADADIVRLTSAVDDDLGRVLLAVQFRAHLTEEDCATLGLSTEPDPTELPLEEDSA